MLAIAIQHLEKWIRNTLGDIRISQEPPAMNSGESTVHLYLRNIERSDVTGLKKTSPNRLVLVFWVTITGSSTQENNDSLITLINEAINNPILEIELGEPSAYEWLAFGIKPQPSCCIKIHINQVEPDKDVKLVLEPHVLLSEQK